jgi:small subunit ribosomal protein S13e
MMPKEKENAKEDKGKPNWIKMKHEDVEKLIVELAQKGEDPAKIGLVLRDSHGVPKTKLFGKKITQVLVAKKVPFNDEKKLAEKEIEKLRGHVGKNKHDHSASRALTKKLWALRKLEAR